MPAAPVWPLRSSLPSHAKMERQAYKVEYVETDVVSLWHQKQRTTVETLKTRDETKHIDIKGLVEL